MLKFINPVPQPEVFPFPQWPFFGDDEIAKVSTVLNSGKVNYWTGTEGRLFEEEYARASDTEYAIALMNGTVALEAALYALEIGPGDEVITSCRTFIASASAVIMRGAIPVLADVDLCSQNITAASIKAVLSPRTKAIIVVHLAGWPCDMDPILELAKLHQLYVIEDCAQAHGAKYKNKPVGSLGDVAAFSFCQDKILTTGGEGGMITTHSQALWEKIWSFKDHGKSYEAVYKREHPLGFRWLHESFGTNFRMTEMQAAIGRIQLGKLDVWKAARQRNANILMEGLAHIKGLMVHRPPTNVEHAFYKFYAFIEPEKLKVNWTRDRILESINARHIPCFSGICGEIYLEKAFTESGLGPTQRFPNAKKLGETSLMFLVHPTLTIEHMQKTVQVVTEVMEEAT